MYFDNDKYLFAAKDLFKDIQYPTTVDDLLAKLKDPNIFTKLDMTPAFHQIKLDQDSQFITAFQSNTRIKYFKQLIFSVNSAAEEL